MQLEKINENQIRVKLTQEDLDSRGLDMGELAYGTDKARRLFREVMQQAEIELDFHVHDMPLMIEAVPMTEGVLLIVTRVTNPEEFDARLASFSPSIQQEARNGPDTPVSPDQGFDHLLENIRRKSARPPVPREAPAVQNAEGSKGPAEDESSRQAGAGKAADQAPETTPPRAVLVYEFDSAFSAIQAARSLVRGYSGDSSLYRDPRTGSYCLVLSMDPVTPDSPHLSLLTSFMEYADPLPLSHVRQRYLQEHCELLCAENAVQYLSEMGGE